MATKNAKKVAAPKPAKVAKPAKEIKAKATLISFSVSAVIPTQQYGNIQPKIEVVAASIEDARAVVMPVIEDLYRTYAEAPLNGKELKFLGKITETVKEVAPAAQVAPTAPKEGEKATAAPETVQEAPAAPEKPKSDAVLRAEKAISLALTEDAVLAIEAQIEKSTKIAPEDKPALITLVLKKRGEFKK